MTQEKEEKKIEELKLKLNIDIIQLVINNLLDTEYG